MKPLNERAFHKILEIDDDLSPEVVLACADFLDTQYFFKIIIKNLGSADTAWRALPRAIEYRHISVTITVFTKRKIRFTAYYLLTVLFRDIIDVVSELAAPEKSIRLTLKSRQFDDQKIVSIVREIVSRLPYNVRIECYNESEHLTAENVE